jgi:hypothetical protein
VFVSGKPFQPSLKFAGKARVKHLVPGYFYWLVLIACQDFKVFFLVGDEKQNTKHFSLSLTGEKIS